MTTNKRKVVKKSSGGTFTLRLSPELHDLLVKKAIDRNRSLSDLIRDAIRFYPTSIDNIVPSTKLSWSDTVRKWFA